MSYTNNVANLGNRKADIKSYFQVVDNNFIFNFFFKGVSAVFSSYSLSLCTDFYLFVHSFIFC